MKQITKYFIKNSLRRILLYHSCLTGLRKMGVKRVYSYTLAREVSVSSEQVRKDFAEFGLTGNKKGGYKIDELLERMEYIFHRKKNNNIVLIGMGNIGQALSKYGSFVRRNMNIVATFDIDPFKLKTRSEIPVYPMDRLKEVIEAYGARVAIIAVPEVSAQEVADQVVRFGIRGIVNFAPVLLKVPSDVVVNNVNLCDELECVIYYVHNLIKSNDINSIDYSMGI